MKVAIFVVLMSLCFLASAKEYEKTWGDVTKLEHGREHVTKQKYGEYQTYYTFTYPQVATDKRIVGLKHIDHHPPTKVEFVKGYIGDHQITLKVTAEGHDLDSVFVFYTDKC